MGQELYMLGKEIVVTYQADGLKSGRTVIMEIFDPTGMKDPVEFPDVTMDELGTTGRYQGTFTPDVIGDWVVMVAQDGPQKAAVVKQYSVGHYNLSEIGDMVENLEPVDSPPMIG